MIPIESLVPRALQSEETRLQKQGQPLTPAAQRLATIAQFQDFGYRVAALGLRV